MQGLQHMMCVTRNSSQTNRQLLGQQCNFKRSMFAAALMLLPCSIWAETTAANVSSAFEIRQAQPDLAARLPDRQATVAPLAPLAIPAQADSVQFTLQQLSLTGNSVLSTAQLQAAWQPMLGQNVTLAEIYALANRLSAQYQAKGYILSRVIVPEQTVQDGRVRLQVIEGKISQVSVVGTGAERRLPRAYADQLTAEPVTTAQTLERTILLFGDLAGVTAQAFVKPMSAQGELELVVQMTEKPAQFNLGMHNRVSKSVGEVRVEASVLAGDWLGLFDQHYLGLNSSMDRKVNTLVYQGSLPLGSNGLQGSLSLSGSQVRPELNGVELSSSESMFTSLGWSYPALRSRTQNIVAYGSLDLNNNQRDSSFDGQREIDEKIRALSLGARIEMLDDWRGVNQLDWSSQVGLNNLGASQARDPLLSGAAGRGDPQFFKQNLYAARLQSLGYGLSVLTAVNAQWSKDALLASQQLTLGGSQFLRAYDPGEIAGDRGISAKAELRHQWQLGALALTNYGFYDWGEVRMKSLRPSGALAYREDRAQSVGLGSRFSTRWGVSGYLELAMPIERQTNAEQSTDPRVFGGLAVSF